MKKLLPLFACLAFFCFAAAATAEEKSEAAGLKADVLASFEDAADKIVQLAEAIPVEKYGWSPGEGVRTVSQVFMHVAVGNYFLGSLVGGTKPDNLKDFEKETDKAKVIAALKASNDYARKLIQDMPEAELAKTIDFFGKPASKRLMLIRVAGHSHEHLGQAIAYARSVGTTPPWSKKEG